MTKDEQAEFIKTICDSTKQFMLDKLDKIPPNWEGWELRHWFEHNASMAVWGDMRNKRSKRYKDYKNDLITRGL